MVGGDYFLNHYVHLIFLACNIMNNTHDKSINCYIIKEVLEL